MIPPTEPFVGLTFGRPKFKPSIVNKTEDTILTEQDSIDNTYDADEVSPKISYGDFQNQVSAIMSGISLLKYYQVTRPELRIILLFSFIHSR